MSILSTIVKVATKAPSIEDYDSYLFIGPHPDDIEIGAGATAAKLTANGKKVTFLICLDGRYGDEFLEGKSAEEVALIRRKESIASAKVLGVNDVRFLDLCDGGFYKKKDLSKGIAKVIGDVKPDVVFSPDFWVSSECHIDHVNVGRIVSYIVEIAPYKGIMKRLGASNYNVKSLALYMTARPNQFVNTRRFFKRQHDALFNCHISQFPSGTTDADSLNLYLNLRSKIYGIRRFTTDCEAFRVLERTHMHCLPEASKF